MCAAVQPAISAHVYQTVSRSDEAHCAESTLTTADGMLPDLTWSASADLSSSRCLPPAHQPCLAVVLPSHIHQAGTPHPTLRVTALTPDCMQRTHVLLELAAAYLALV